MKRLKLVLTPMLLAGLALVLAGCSESDPTSSTAVGTDDFAAMDMNDKLGGLTATDEPVGFGDDELVAEAQAADGTEIGEDQFGGEQAGAIRREIVRLRTMGENGQGEGPHRPSFTFLRLKWGDLDGPEELAAVDGDLVDWSGLLSVDRGIVIVRRVIRFERPYDHLVAPRLDPQTVAWVSHTGGHYDGLLVEIIERPVDELDEPVEANRLHIETGPFTRSFTIEELPDLDEIYEVEPEGQAIHLNGFTLQDLNACPTGFLSGRWRPLTEEEAAADTTGALGYFRGRWIGLLGHVQGYLRGAYGVDDEGQRVFFGKYIDRQGRFRGFLRGTWDPADEEGNWSLFRGSWLSANEENEGLLGGRAYHLPESAGGFFEGRWATSCDPIAAELIQ